MINTRFSPLAQSCEKLFSHPIDITKEFSNVDLLLMAEEIVDDWLDELVIDIMVCKSLSLGEAQGIAARMMLAGIKPKSDKFYETMEKIKTMWEY